MDTIHISFFFGELWVAFYSRKSAKAVAGDLLYKECLTCGSLPFCY